MPVSRECLECLESTGPTSRNMCASFSGVSPVWNRRRWEESCGSLAQAQASARVDEPTALCTSFLHDNARICAQRTTDRDLESQRHEKVDAWICARRTTERNTREREEEKKDKNANV